MTVKDERPPDLGDGSARVGGLLPVGRLSPLRITGIYLAFGTAALVLSDVVLVSVLSDPLLAQVQAVKGAVEVLLTGGLIYVLTSWNEAARERTTAELHRHREELRVLHRVLRHNLRNNLTVIRGNARDLRERLTGEEAVTTCDSVIEATDEIIHYTQRMDEIRRLTGSTDRVRLELAEAVPRVVETAGVWTGDVDLSVSTPESAAVEVSSAFESALSELVGNAVQHSDGDRPDVSVSVEPHPTDDRMVVVEVADNGPGLPEHVRQVLVDDERNQLVHMDGLGLWFVYLAVVESGGEFTVPRSGPDGTTIRIALPRARN